ncbi:MAG TPA: homocysteine S-methyltransferase family protein, partial [Acidobacteriota bacterium]|nr:homocysteine S-methyltransferase family protein [Acidobacteriota bacterium]
MKPFHETLQEDRIYVFDGAMGTMLYSKGVYVNRCYDEICLSNPGLVQEVHREYIKAGAEIIETNTFAANFPKLEAFGHANLLQEINYKAAKIAREVAGTQAWVAGAIGPLGIRIEPWGPTSFEEARKMFREQAEALLDGGVDLIVLETFTDLSEIRQAMRTGSRKDWPSDELCDVRWAAVVAAIRSGNPLQALADNARELGLTYEDG